MEKGQALLIVILVMVLAITVGMSVGIRSISTLRSSVDEENSQRAFSAAEAGIEKVLKTRIGITEPVPLGNNAQIKRATITSVSQNQLLLSNGTVVQKDEGADLWLAQHRTDGTIDYSGTSWSGTVTIYWGSSSNPCENPALEIILISGQSAADAISKRYAVDPCDTSQRRQSNKFSPPDPSSGSVNLVNTNFYHVFTVSSVANGLLMRVIPLYASSKIGVAGQDNTLVPQSFPSQGNIIESVGTAGNTERKITFFQGYPRLPAEFFQYILFSPQ